MTDVIEGTVPDAAGSTDPDAAGSADPGAAGAAGAADPGAAGSAGPGTADSAGPTGPDAMADAIDALLGDAAEEVASLRARRPITRREAQASHDALLGGDSAGATLAEKRAVAAFTARLHGDDEAARHYAAGLADAVAAAVLRAAAASALHGPYGVFASSELQESSRPGPAFTVDDALTAAVGARLGAALEYAHALVFRPREAEPAWVRALSRAGWGPDGIVTVSQLVAFLAFQLRVVAGLAALAGAPRAVPAAADPDAVGPVRSARPAASGTQPVRFTRDELEWDPWVAPVDEAALTAAQRDALVDAGRARSPYFRLLARDPGILKARTLTDKDIFYNVADGLPRAERELAAAAVSRVNGCLYCASVHSRFAAHYSKRVDDVQRLLDEGVAGAQEPRWRAIVDAAAALAATPAAFGAGEIAALRAEGLSDAEISDLVHGAAFFSWANRLMLALGEPRV